VQRARRKWRTQQRHWDPARLVFLDETWASTNMARRYGRAPRGQRCVAAVPHGHWKTTTFIAALRHDGLTAPMLLDGPIDGAAFLTYVQAVLAPTLHPGDIVVADNLASHKVNGVRETIAQRGATSSTCRLTRPTSIPSKSCSPNSRLCCAKPPNAPSTPSGTTSPSCSTPSPHMNAPTTSPPPDT